MLAQHWQSVAEMLVGRMLNGVAEGLIIALCGWLLLRGMRRQNSSTRFAVWLATLLAVAALPVAMLRGASSSGGSTTATRFAFLLPASWATDAFFVWAVIAAAGLAKIVFGFWQLHKLRRSCIPLNETGLPPEVLRAFDENRFNRRVLICASDKVRVPAAIGFIKAAIIIPTWALEELTPAELNVVVLHELAHLRRWDDWTNLAQKIVSALLFFQPAVWWIGRSLAREREMACDDFVLAATSDHRGYAQCLVSVAEKSFLRRGLALAQAMAGRMQLTAQRVARILHCARSTEKPATKVWKPAVALVTAVSAVCLVSLAHEPNLVAFDNGSSEGTAIAETAPHFNARVMPTSFTTRSDNNVALEKPMAKISLAKHVAHRHAAVAATSVVASTEHPPMYVINAYAGASVHATVPHTVLVIMQSNQVDAYGRIWNVSVWQLTVYHPDQSAGQQVRKGVPPKST